MAASTWETEDLVALEAIAAVELVHGAPTDELQLVGEACPEINLQQVLRRLAQGHYIGGRTMPQGGGRPEIFYEVELLPAGRRAIGQWPSPDQLLSRLLSSIRDAALGSQDESERSRLGKAADALQEVMTGSTSALIAQLLAKAVGLA